MEVKLHMFEISAQICNISVETLTSIYFEETKFGTFSSAFCPAQASLCRHKTEAFRSSGRFVALRAAYTPSLVLSPARGGHIVQVQYISSPTITAGGHGGMQVEYCYQLQYSLSPTSICITPPVSGATQNTTQ
jgi:hypothetical protein